MHSIKMMFKQKCLTALQSINQIKSSVVGQANDFIKIYCAMNSGVTIIHLITLDNVVVKHDVLVCDHKLMHFYHAKRMFNQQRCAVLQLLKLTDYCSGNNLQH